MIDLEWLNNRNAEVCLNSPEVDLLLQVLAIDPNLI